MISSRKMNIAVACGGTGGHTFPGLATARVLRARGHAVTLWIAGRDIEDQTVKGWDGPVFKTGARPLKRAVQRYLQDPLADLILRGDVRDGAVVKVDEGDGALVFAVG